MCSADDTREHTGCVQIISNVKYNKVLRFTSIVQSNLNRFGFFVLFGKTAIKRYQKKKKNTKIKSHSVHGIYCTPCVPLKFCSFVRQKLKYTGNLYSRIMGRSRNAKSPFWTQKFPTYWLHQSTVYRFSSLDSRMTTALRDTNKTNMSLKFVSR